MKITFETYFNRGDRVRHIDSGKTGTVQRSGTTPHVLWDNGVLNQSSRVRLIRTNQLRELVKKIKSKLSNL